jgi:RNA polymerase sigma factor (sigma-70 family)
VADTRLTGLIRHLHATPPVAPPPDGEALAAFVTRRDESAFTAIVGRHGPMVLNVCRRVLGHQQDAEDAFQATFLVLARKAASVGRAESLASWLHGVAVRLALRARRDAGRRRAREQHIQPGAEIDPAEALAWRDVQTLLETEVRRLPERYRAPFVLCHLEGRGRAEAAAELGLSENTLSSRLARARDRLRDRLARRGVQLSAVLAALALSGETVTSALPSEFLSTTIRAGVQFAARQPVAGVAGPVLQLTRGALTSMTAARVQLIAGVIAVGGILAVGTWVAGQGPATPPGASSPPPAERTDDKPANKIPDADYAQRQQSQKNIRLIAIALINYHDAHNRFPDDIKDKAGKSLLSWRVEILPYLEQHELYKLFKRDEPWDSPHNFKLLSKMPVMFRTATDPKDAPHTYYQRFALVGGVWGNVVDPSVPMGGGSAAGPLPGASGPAGGPPGAGGPADGPPGIGAGAATPTTAAPPSNGPRFPMSFVEVTDGTSNTLGVIEAGPPVPWTKPADIRYDYKRPLPPMVGPYANVRNAATLDGAFHALKPKLAEEVWRRLIEPNDGQVLPDWKEMHARFAADSAEEKKALARLVEENQEMIKAMEKLMAENAVLLRKYTEATGDVEQAEETQAWLKRRLEELRAVNKKFRDEFGMKGRPAPPK